MVTNKKGYVADWYKKKREALIEELGGKCDMCCSHYNLEIHHVKPLNGDRPNGRLERLAEWVANKDNLRVLCHNCHCNVHGMEKWYER